MGEGTLINEPQGEIVVKALSMRWTNGFMRELHGALHGSDLYVFLIYRFPPSSVSYCISSKVPAFPFVR